MNGSLPVTIGDIANRYGVPVHRVAYVIRTRKIQEAGWAGHARLFRESDVEHIASELERIARIRDEMRV